MLAKIPPEVARFGLTILLKKYGCELFKDPGKVSEMRIIPNYPDLLMIVTLPRKSIFEFVLNGLFRKTNEVITAMTVLIQGTVLKELGISTHLVAYGKGIDQYLPPKLQNNAKLQKCALIVKKHIVEDVEWIWRFNHTGSAVKSLKETGMVYGHPVCADIKEGEEYDHPLDTPTTKEEEGHDMPISRELVVEKYRKHTEFTQKIAIAIRDYFKERGIIVADLKLECSIGLIGTIFLLDKFGPDEARFWDRDDWVKAMAEGRVPKSMDKEILRILGKSIETPFVGTDKSPIVGINKLDPKNPDHIAFVHKQRIPQEVVEATVNAYLEIFRRAYDGKSLEDFQREIMKIAV